MKVKRSLYSILRLTELNVDKYSRFYSDTDEKYIFDKLIYSNYRSFEFKNYLINTYLCDAVFFRHAY